VELRMEQWEAGRTLHYRPGPRATEDGMAEAAVAWIEQQVRDGRLGRRDALAPMESRP
jgi:hypothetical protein